jgi:hypothetical protein
VAYYISCTLVEPNGVGPVGIPRAVRVGKPRGHPPTPIQVSVDVQLHQTSQFCGPGGDALWSPELHLSLVDMRDALQRLLDDDVDQSLLDQTRSAATVVLPSGPPRRVASCPNRCFTDCPIWLL